MTILDRVYASGGTEVLIATLELSCAQWAAPVLLCQGFEDQTCRAEDGRVLTFQGCGIDVALPKRNNSGGQSVTFAIDGVMGEAQQRIDAALKVEAQISLTLRIYLDTDRNAPAERPYYMKVKGGQIKQATVQIDAGYYDLINTAWPRNVYTTTNAPGLTYL